MYLCYKGIKYNDNLQIIKYIIIIFRNVELIGGILLLIYFQN